MILSAMDYYQMISWMIMGVLLLIILFHQLIVPSLIYDPNSLYQLFIDIVLVYLNNLSWYLNSQIVSSKFVVLTNLEDEKDI